MLVRSWPYRFPGRTRWEAGWSAIAHTRIWPAILLGCGAMSTVIYPHPPLVALSTVAGSTLKLRPALNCGLTLWLLSQIYGFTVRSFPLEPESFLWMGVMGLGMAIATLWASLRPVSSQLSARGHCVWLGLALLGGFVAYEGLIHCSDFLLTKSHYLTWDVLGRLWIKESLWTIGLGTIHCLLVKRRI